MDDTCILLILMIFCYFYNKHLHNTSIDSFLKKTFYLFYFVKIWKSDKYILYLASIDIFYLSL